jgi:cellulose synthase/poly-beta-1,6-N-acetylglucosamine synthase-like glycosyltransferase
MTTSLAVIFWLSVALLGYAYGGYALIVYIAARLRPAPDTLGDAPLPFVSLIISVHNETELLEVKLRNTTELDYPKDRLEVIVAADGPTDAVRDVLAAWAERGLRTSATARWMGKTAAQNLAAAAAKGDVLVFSDVAAEYAADAVFRLVRPLAAPAVGCVTGKVVYREPAHEERSAIRRGAGLRLRSELALRANQSRAGVLFGATGCIYAVRRELFAPVRDDLANDFALPLQLLAQGYRTLYVPEAVAVIRRGTDLRSEFARRSRVVLQCLRALWEVRFFANPARHGLLLALTFWHRLLRWLGPLLLMAVLGTSIALSGHHVYRLALLIQLGFLLLAAAGTAWPRGARLGSALSVPAYFLLVNLAALAGLIRLLRGETGAAWEPTGGGSRR